MLPPAPSRWRSLVPLLASGRLATHTLRLVFAGGSASPATLIDDIERHGIENLQTWGVTETGPIACVSRPRRRHLGLDRADGQRIGELEVRGPWVITEYYGEDADERFHDGWLRIGDMSVMEPDGYLRIVDPSKDLVTSGGGWISSIQLESLPLTSVGKVDKRTIRARLALQLDGLAGECPVDDLHRVQRRCPG